MHRRHFVKVAAAGTSLIVRPSWALALVPAMKITRFRVGLQSDMVQLGSHHGPGFVSRSFGPSPRPGPDRENHYEAAVIQVGDRFWYRAKGATIEVTANEAHQVRGCPLLFYFSTALKLHVRINWKLAHGVDCARP